MFGHDDDQATTNVPVQDESAQPTAPTMPASDDSATYLDNIAPTPPAAPSAPAPANNNDLLDLKQQALQQLTPLVDHLDQTPEEKFRTTMMMIQASDNAALIHEAYNAALQITDEKARAQALLDIVNEINYFTQQNAQ